MLHLFQLLGNKQGDVYYVESESAGYVWIDDNGTLRWELLGMTVDTSNFLTKTGLAQTTGNATDNTMSQKAISDELQSKQHTLIAGNNITIENNVISATGGEGGETDTGWLPLTLGSGVTGYSWASPVYRKIGNIISVQGVVKASSLSSGSTTICTLPYGSKTEYGIALRTGNGIQPFSLRPSGILAPNYSGTNVDIWLSFTYMIA